MINPVDTFRAEAQEHLAALEQALLDLELQPENVVQIAAAFRAMHTIKGSAGMVGFDHLSYFTHHLESLFESVRSGEIILTPELCQCVIQASDHISDLLVSTEPSAELVVVSETILARLKGVLPNNNNAANVNSVATTKNQTEKQSFYRVDIQPHSNSFKDGLDIFPILRELNELGKCHVSAYFNNTFNAEKFDPESCYLRLQVLLLTNKDKDSIQDVFIFVSDDWLIQITKVEPEEAHRLGDLLVAHGVVDAAALEAILQSQPKTGELLSHSGLVKPDQIQRALSEQQYIRNQVVTKEEQSIRVAQHKLDQLMDHVGELVILQAGLDQLALNNNDERLFELAEELNRLSNGLRDIAFDIRMLPIGSTFARFRRLIRDLCRDLGKDVVLETNGADTELDKVVLDKLVEPLVHMLRNSLDHGIESPSARRELDKPEKGIITLSARHHQGQILIEIRDDGAGLDKEKILAKALNRGLISKETVLDESSIYQLIFEPGFSTAEKVSDVSGRGVGMDVVKSAIDALQGQISIESTKNCGTSFRILLPMTLSIIEGLMVSVSGQKFIVPLNLVEECIETLELEPNPRSDTCLVQHRGQLVPRLRLREKFELQGKRPAIEQTVIVRVGEDAIGITVDEVIGNHQTVIRNLGRLYQNIPGVMGATILGDGGIAMILDLLSLSVSSRKRDMN
ncbi:MAG TPA: chemotaxis protein CheA [Cellvibrio sp.]|nr:chemotaxis protein CheA [Cellvibrio sp.]